MERNLQFELMPDGFTVLIGGNIFTRFIARNSVPKPIFYPVCTPSGISVTRRVPEIDDCCGWRSISHSNSGTGAALNAHEKSPNADAKPKL